jgi:hypothetical protein
VIRKRRDLSVRQLLGAPEHNARTQCQGLRRFAAPRPLDQLVVFFHAKSY